MAKILSCAEVKVHTACIHLIVDIDILVSYVVFSAFLGGLLTGV